MERGFRSYGHYWAEGAKLPALPASTITSRFVIAEGLEYLYAAKERGQGIIIALPHIGSWEWGGAYLHIARPHDDRGGRSLESARTL